MGGKPLPTGQHTRTHECNVSGSGDLLHSSSKGKSGVQLLEFLFFVSLQLHQTRNQILNHFFALHLSRSELKLYKAIHFFFVCYSTDVDCVDGDDDRRTVYV